MRHFVVGKRGKHNALNNIKNFYKIKSVIEVMWRRAADISSLHLAIAILIEF